MVEEQTIELSDYFGKCDWCGCKMSNTIHAIYVGDQCFNVCDSCGTMLKEKIATKKKKDKQQKEMLKMLYRIGHPEKPENVFIKFIRRIRS